MKVIQESDPVIGEIIRLREDFALVYEHSGQAVRRQKLYNDKGLKARSFELNS